MLTKCLLTDRVDVEKAHVCSEYGVEHAVVQSLCRPHQHVEQSDIPDEAKNDGGRSQTCRRRSRASSFTAQREHKACGARCTVHGARQQVGLPP